MFNSGSSFLMSGTVFGGGNDSHAQSPPPTADSQGMSQSIQQKPQRPKQMLLPVTLKMVTSLDTEAGADVTIHGKPALSCLSVCQIIRSERKNASFEFMATDTTATCKILYYYDADDAELVASLESIKPMEYIRVIGQVRISPEPLISAITISKVTEHDEVPFHLIEAVTVAMKLANPEKAAGLTMEVPSENMFNNNMMTPEPVSKPTTNIGASKIELPTTTMVEKIKKWLGDNAREGGYTFAQIADGCKVSLNEVGSHIEELLDGGELQTTNDDDHVSLMPC